MEVLVYDPFLSAEDIKERVSGTKAELDELLEKSDVVTLNLPHNEETNGLFDYAKLKKMKKSAVLVNTARGGVIIQEDLAKLVEEGWFHGVGLDVTIDEPIKPDNPFLKLDKVTLTAHTAASTVEFYLRAARSILEDHQRVAKGEKPTYARNSI
jgi:phosphoglycerate dehydrogenase-like enzyme